MAIGGVVEVVLDVRGVQVSHVVGVLKAEALLVDFVVFIEAVVR